MIKKTKKNWQSKSVNVSGCSKKRLHSAGLRLKRESVTQKNSVRNRYDRKSLSF